MRDIAPSPGDGFRGHRSTVRSGRFGRSCRSGRQNDPLELE